MEFSTQERVQILYELSLSFGNSFDLQKLFKESAVVFLKKLNATALFVYRYANDSTALPLYVTPRTAKRDNSYVSTIEALLNQESIEVLRKKKPGLLAQQESNGVYYYIFSLGSFGLFVLLKKERTLSYELLRDLESIFVKFTNSIESCLAMEELEHKKVEAEYLLEEAKQASQAKSNFLANMSHEIRTPLNAIGGFIQILQEMEVDQKKLKYLETIHQASSNLLEIINDILDFSKIESGKSVVESVDFDALDAFEGVFKLFEARAKQKGVTLHFRHQSIPEFLRNDVVKIKQILNNLLSNAIKFTPESKHIYFSVEYKQGHLYVSVKDEGIGINKESLTSIFEPFTQEDASTTRKYGGTGLGLSIAVHFVNLLGGELEVKSEEGVGSEFYFNIPVELGKSVVKEKQTPMIGALEGNILVVEDNEHNQLFMQTVLERFGVAHEIANDGLEAYEMFLENSYDVIVMDENMPRLNGIEATKKIRQHEEQNSLVRTPIIALSANAFEEDKARFFAAGMDEFLAKPLRIEKLYEMLKKIIQSQRIIDADVNQESKSIEQKLKHIDIEYGLSLVMGIESIYKRILEGLLHYKTESFTQLDDDELQRVMHTIKGMAASAGAQRLSEMAKELELSLDREKIILFQEHLQEVVEEIEAYILRVT